MALHAPGGLRSRVALPPDHPKRASPLTTSGIRGVTLVKIVSPLSQREVEATTVDFEGKSEPWSTYELDDGTTLKIRVTITGIARLEGEFDPHGNPVYTVQSGTIVRIVKSKVHGQPTTPGGSAAKPAKSGPEVG